MNKVKGITTGTYLTKTLKDSKNKGTTAKQICSSCKMKEKCKYGKISKFDNGKVFDNNVECDYFYFSITSKAIVITGRDTITGKRTTKTFVGKNEKEALNKALSFQIEMEKNGDFKVITKSNKNIIDLVKDHIEEDYKLGKIIKSTYKRKSDTIKKLKTEKFTNKPISKVTRDEVIRYLESLKCYSKSTIKQNYELLCMAFGQAKYENIITDNFMEGYNRVEKPKSDYKGHHRIALTVEEQKKLVNHLNNVEYKDCKYKYILLLLISTGMRIGEALVLDYEKDIDLENKKIYIRRTQTKDSNGKAIIGDTTKTNSGQRVLNMNNIITQIIEGALEHKIENKNHLLFCKDDKTMYVENSINSSLKRIALSLGIGIYEEENKDGRMIQKTDVHTHMLRGTFATRCAEAKIAPAVLKKILGHSDITITMQYYVDVDNEFEKSENKNVEDYLKDKEIFNLDLDDD
jgi:integrase